MKRNIFVALSALFFAQETWAADGFYVGADLANISAKHSYRQFGYEGLSGPSHKISREHNFGVGASAGYTKYLDNSLYLAPEIFYDNLDSRARDFYVEGNPSDSTPGDYMTLKNRYGIKLNVGYSDLLPKLSLFVNAGVTRVGFEQRWHGNNDTGYEGKYYRSSTIAPIYGIGAKYDLTNNISVRLAYEMQRFNIKYIDEGFRDKVRLNVTKIGLVYNF